MDNLHFYELKHICQLEWISSSHKPKHTTARFDNLLLNTVIQKIDAGLESREDYHNIMQGFRNKKNIDVHLKMQRLLIDKKDFFNPKHEGKEKEWALNMVNLFYSFVSNKKKQFGIYARYAKEEVDEILAHYEDDFCEAAQHLDAEGITKLAQVMYLLKSGRYENIWWRIENRVHDLAEVKGALDDYHISNIIRSFSRSQENLMSGSDKLFVHLEPLIINQINNFNSRDLSHVMYGYSIRDCGNPELYKAIDKRVEDLLDQGEVFDYPTCHNMLYYLMFKDSLNEKIWKGVVDSAVAQDDVLPIVYYKAFKFSKFYL